MASPPSSAVAGAAVAASALADVVATLARTTPVPADAARAALTVCRGVARVSAPRLVDPAGVAAVAAALVGAAQGIARAATPADASAGLYAAAAVARTCAPASTSPALTRYYALARALCAGVEAACLGEAFLAEARTGFADRSAASAARTRIRDAHEGAADRVAALLGQPAATLLDTAAREASAHLVQEAASLRPVVRVQAGRSFPAGALAWSLYDDPERAGELMLRNGCGTPFFMPAEIEAVGPGSA